MWRCGVVIATSELYLGSYALTSHGLLPDNFRRVAGIIYRDLTIAKELSDTRDAEVYAGSKSS